MILAHSANLNKITIQSRKRSGLLHSQQAVSFSALLVCTLETDNSLLAPVPFQRPVKALLQRLPTPKIIIL